MNKYRIRFNKGRGQPGRGTADHVWRVFENDQEYIVKNITLNVQASGEKEPASDDWNIVCYGFMDLQKAESHAIINSVKS